MSENLFSTGSLIASWGGVTTIVEPSQLSTQRYYPSNGTAPISPGASGTYPASNATDGNIDTIADFSVVYPASQYLVVDMGQTRNISQVALNNCSGGAAAGVSIYIGSVATDPPGSPSMAQLGSTQTGVNSGNMTFSAGTGLALSGRYVFVTGACAAGFNLDPTVGEIVPTQAVSYIAPGGITFGTMQDIQFSAAWTRKDLYDAAQYSAFPVDSADHEGKFTITAKSADMDASRLQILAAAVLSSVTINDNTATLATILENDVVEYFATTCQLVSSTGLLVEIAANNVKAKGVSLAAKLDDFMVPDFTVDCYPDSNGNVAILSFQD